MRLTTYYIGSWSAWFLFRTRTKRMARSEGVQEFGRGRVREVRPATLPEIKYFTALKGPRAIYG